MSHLNSSLADLGYREAEVSDIPEIVQIHMVAFPGFFMTLLGPEFLERYYRLLIDFPDRIFWVKQWNMELEGFVSGFLNPDLFYQGLRRCRWNLLGSIVARVSCNPSLIPRLLASYAQAGHSSEQEEADVCELSSIAVPPNLSGRGIGKGLVNAFIEATRGRARSIVLTTDADGNEKVNGFYRSLGFVCEGAYERSKGRRLNIYRLWLDAQK